MINCKTNCLIVDKRSHDYASSSDCDDTFLAVEDDNDDYSLHSRPRAVSATPPAAVLQMIRTTSPLLRESPTGIAAAIPGAENRRMNPPPAGKNPPAVKPPLPPKAKAKPLDIAVRVLQDMVEQQKKVQSDTSKVVTDARDHFKDNFTTELTLKQRVAMSKIISKPEHAALYMSFTNEEKVTYVYGELEELNL